MGAPDGSTRVACEERVVDSLVGLGLLCRRNGEGVNGLHGLLDGLLDGTSILLLFPTFLLTKNWIQFFISKLK